MLEGSFKADPIGIIFSFSFLRFHLTSLVLDMKHMLKIIPDKYEVYFSAHKNTTNISFTKFLNGSHVRFSL